MDLQRVYRLVTGTDSLYILMPAPTIGASASGALSQCLIPVFWLCPKAISVHLKWPLNAHISWFLQDSTVILLNSWTRKTLLPYMEYSVSDIPTSKQFTCSAVKPSCQLCQITPWSGITIAEQLQFEFPICNPHQSVWCHVSFLMLSRHSHSLGIFKTCGTPFNLIEQELNAG